MNFFSKKKLQTHRRPFLLLEVLIAFALVVLCILPFLGANLFMSVTEKQFAQDVDMDRLVNLQLVALVEKLYLNEIKWPSIVEGIEGPFHVLPKIPYEGKYFIKLKESKEGNRGTSYNKIHVQLTLTPKKEKRLPLVFTYIFFAEHDAIQGKPANFPKNPHESNQT